MATIKDIAQRVGVSTCTVSRYINGKIKVKEETAAKIDRAIEELDYYKNYSAVSLKTNSSAIVALIIPSMKNLLFAEIAERLVGVLEQKGYTIVTFATENRIQKEKDAVKKLMELRVAGAVFITLPYMYEDGEHIHGLQKQGVNCLMINRFFEENEFMCISTDFYNGSRDAVRFLYENGCRRIALVTGAPGQPQSETYISGYKAGLKEVGLPVSDELIKYCYYDEGKMDTVTRELFSEGADGIFCITDYMALVALDVSKEYRERRKKTCLISSGNTKFADLVGLSSVDHKTRVLGEKGANMLLNAIEGRESENFVLIAPEIVDRQQSKSI